MCTDKMLKIMQIEHIHNQNDTLDYNYITDGIFIGTNQCCTVGLSLILQKEGVTAVISLEEDRIDQPFGVSAYLWLPTIDHTPPTQGQLMLGSETLKILVEQNKKVYVHCKNGHGRAPTLVGAYLIKKGLSLEEAESLMIENRSTVKLWKIQKEALLNFSK